MAFTILLSFGEMPGAMQFQQTTAVMGRSITKHFYGSSVKQCMVVLGGGLDGFLCLA